MEGVGAGRLGELSIPPPLLPLLPHSPIAFPAANAINHPLSQWLTSISHDLVRPDRGPFAPASPGNAILELNPLLSSSLRPSLDIARFAGRCVGVLIMYKRVLDAAIAPHFFKTLMGRRPGLEDLEAVDGELYRALGWML